MESIFFRLPRDHYSQWFGIDIHVGMAYFQRARNPQWAHKRPTRRCVGCRDYEQRSLHQQHRLHSKNHSKRDSRQPVTTPPSSRRYPSKVGFKPEHFDPSSLPGRPRAPKSSNDHFRQYRCGGPSAGRGHQHSGTTPQPSNSGKNPRVMNNYR